MDNRSRKVTESRNSIRRSNRDFYGPDSPGSMVLYGLLQYFGSPYMMCRIFRESTYAFGPRETTSRHNVIGRRNNRRSWFKTDDEIEIEGENPRMEEKDV